MKKFFSIVCLSLLLFGCEEKYTVEQLKNDPQLLSKVSDECMQMSPEQRSKEDKCLVVAKAVEAMAMEKVNAVSKIFEESTSLQDLSNQLNEFAEEQEQQ